MVKIVNRLIVFACSNTSRLDLLRVVINSLLQDTQPNSICCQPMFGDIHILLNWTRA